ncbi:hypothetical protein GCM10023176_58310 [Micromonospora coerulea]|uniref:NAD-dependent epimerase/dehydratase domain-containing protein n=1 Tax=Micromonospora coerulea TaxID=47856 RepID=A0ABP8T5J1_9ACTN
MRVLLAGAGGAIGVPLTRKLIDHGHEVYGLTRGQGRARALADRGVRPVVADAMDRDALLRAVDGLAADAVVHELTALTKPPLRHSGMAQTNRLRVEGTANLLAAADVVGARRFLTQSIVLGYGYRDHGDRVLTESDRSASRRARRSTRTWRRCAPPSSRRSPPRTGSRCATACSTAGTRPGSGPS